MYSPAAHNELVGPPSDVPAVSVTEGYGSVLSTLGKRIEFDTDALREIMDGVGIPENQFQNVQMVVGVKPVPGLNGRAWPNEYRTVLPYQVRIYPSVGQTIGLRSERLQETVVHEMKHVSDFIQHDYVDNIDQYNKLRSNYKTRRLIGAGAAAAAGVVATPEVLQVMYETMVAHPQLQSELGIGALLSLPLTLPAMAAIVTGRAMYKNSYLESRAFSAAKTSSNYPRAISFPKT